MEIQEDFSGSHTSFTSEQIQSKSNYSNSLQETEKTLTLDIPLDSIDLLWRTALHTRDEEVAKSAILSLVSLHLNVWAFQLLAVMSHDNVLFLLLGVPFSPGASETCSCEFCGESYGRSHLSGRRSLFGQSCYCPLFGSSKGVFLFPFSPPFAFGCLSPLPPCCRPLWMPILASSHLKSRLIKPGPPFVANR